MRKKLQDVRCMHVLDLVLQNIDGILEADCQQPLKDIISSSFSGAMVSAMRSCKLFVVGTTVERFRCQRREVRISRQGALPFFFIIVLLRIYRLSFCPRDTFCPRDIICFGSGSMLQIRVMLWAKRTNMWPLHHLFMIVQF